MMTADEGLRDTTVESLGKLKPAFAEPDGGRVTAGNSSQITDGASAMLIMSEEKAKPSSASPRGPVPTSPSPATDPRMMLTGPIPATQKVLARAGLTMDDIDLVEINEAFASVVLAWEKELHADMDKVNVNGGAIALGHPLGCSGAADDHPAERARAHRRPLRPADDVRGRRHGQRHHHRAPRLTCSRRARSTALDMLTDVQPHQHRFQGRARRTDRLPQRDRGQHVTILAPDGSFLCIDVDLSWDYSDFGSSADGTLTVQGIFTAPLAARSLPFT
jgi:hypothetical protein